MAAATWAAKLQPTYNLQREFPFQPWFRWSVAIAFATLFALFTVFNIATTGYDLQTKTTDDPNSTLTKRDWFDSPVLTFGDSKLRPTCQTHAITVGDIFFTSNRGLTYTVTTLSTNANSNSTPIQQTSIPYMNNTLENCRVNSVVVYAWKADLSSPGNASHWWSWMTSNAVASAQCDILRPDGVSRITFQVNYAGITDYFDYVILADPQTRASVWWGTRLLNLAFTGIQTLLSQLEMVPSTAATLTYIPNYIGNLSNPGFFNISYFFLSEDGSVYNDGEVGRDVRSLYNNESSVFSAPLTEGWYFAKIFYSLVLIDLGETSKPNLLLDENQLASALNPQDDFNRRPAGPLGSHIMEEGQVDWWKILGISPPNTPTGPSTAVPMTEALHDKAFQQQLGPLGTRNATIITQYICSVPQRKGNATIILLVFLGNWVLLSSSWALLKFISTQVVVARHPDAMLCQRCLGDAAGGEETGMLDEDGEQHPLVQVPVKSKLKMVDTTENRVRHSSSRYSASSSLLGRDENMEVNYTKQNFF